MSNGDKSVVVKIGNMTYRIVADEDEQYVRETAAIADELISQTKKKYPFVNQLTSTVLALVNAVDTMRQAVADRQLAIKKMEDEVALTSEAKAELMRVNEQFWEMKKDLLYFKNLVDVYEEKIAALSQGEIVEKPTKKKKPLDELQRSFDDLKTSG
ncbi:MAG TPA: cell division protein ZapA [Fastidiosipila sp.]|jgi:cell division protein ZapA (FtsZ GTPase activity inhibitor)|nr:cell division protein ZapA [Fastidiosipila sp.]